MVGCGVKASGVHPVGVRFGYGFCMITWQDVRTTTPFGELAALQWGRPDARPLLALHGWLDNAASFAAIAPDLADRRQIIALDLPGHGHSAHAPPASRRYHVVDQVDHVLDFVDAMGWEHFDLMGHSLGAGIAALVAAAVPDRIDKLVLIEGLGPLGDDGSRTLSRWHDAHAHRMRAKHAPRVFGSVDAAVAARVSVGDLGAGEVRNIVERNLRRCAEGYMWRSDARLRLTTPVRMGERQIQRILTGIRAATLLLLAEPATSYLPTSLMKQRAACVDDVHVERIHGPHHLHVRCANDVAQRISGFLAR